MASGIADAAPRESAPDAVLAATPVSFPTSVRLFIRAWLMKALTKLYFGYLVWKKPLPPAQWPTYTKRYSAEPGIAAESRVFIPRTYESGGKPLPLVIDIHGGGFMIGHPVMDDKANACLSQNHNLVVVSIPYRLSPTWKFPTHTMDIAAQIRAVIDDESLPIDRSKVALIGYSAGGSLACSAVQVNNLHNEISAVVGVYPSLDMATKSEDKLKTRISDGKPDSLYPMSQTFFHSYVPVGVNKRDPLLSPLFAPRDKLPRKMFIIGCEHDMLRQEAHNLAEKLANDEGGEKVLTADGAGWQKGNIRYELVKGEIHGFDQIPGKGEESERRRKRADKLWNDIGLWLNKDVFA